MKDLSKLEDRQITDHINLENGDIIFQLNSLQSLKKYLRGE